jgi:hypothetical protein
MKFLAQKLPAINVVIQSVHKGIIFDCNASIVVAIFLRRQSGVNEM